MNIPGVQLVLITFGLFMIYALFLHWKKKKWTTMSGVEMFWRVVCHTHESTIN